MNRSVLLLFVQLALLVNRNSALNSVWRYECLKGQCQKRAITNTTESTALSLSACRLFCADAAAIWPKPTGDVSIGNLLAVVNVHSIDVVGAKSENPTFDLVSGAAKIFKRQIEKLIPRNTQPTGGKSMTVKLEIDDHSIDGLTLDTDESYTLKISRTGDGRIESIVTATNFFGARHGLETLNQLIIYDNLRNELQIAAEVFVADRPAYPYRGVLLDTSRNYIGVDAIKRTLTAMGAAKLNTFHWHITDSHSFPYVSKSRPELAKYGAYAPDKVYTAQDVEEIVQYGKLRGVRILPEFDAPAHVGEGWQNSNLVTCFDWQPWQDYCVEPPCGQFDPTKPALYDAIEDIYRDMFEQFRPDMFHMGGDEVNFNCWNRTDSVVEWMTSKGWGRGDADFVKLWDHFQSQALERVYRQAGRRLPVIMWTSHLTRKEYVLQYLPKDKYIIQIWTMGRDEQVANLLEQGYKLILSNYDALYLDCGFAGWVTDGNNWCSPYVGWQRVYENKPAKVAGNKKSQILGSEATLWTEQVDSAVIDSRLWPRASAMAETLWSEPATSWRDAEPRMLVHRERLVALGVDADALEPEWCAQNEEHCPIGGKFNINNRG
ncbi:chitooligosaccharidolytic beta-N-acetylglucosaminidase [Cylas formicarius]|uniref:chitooligosaccharidolytic beta-N-acetylglucosaminidase n=1 Tax=Cylas formicarius TaxID=197179 RepID=UPI002958CA71|nr:chitooligosaccharidolytic beta-N-acetylglucosaminidase [Cylas formicarius]XP_060536303.1 chitooligosaccharidolytic beta-N-acetylglucosaminidase [Cylas formicarius]XP_060536312.1 chitooligosaccharidolytic beta-N-acetylglucosaminidase [Cylas formicarius]